jgi:hypothetical protein
MSLSKVLEEIKTAKPFAEENLDGAPLETLRARQGRKNQAVERLKVLKRDYRKSLLQSAAFIVVTGEKRDEFSSAATEQFKCFSANPDAFYEDLANRIPPVLYEGKSDPQNLFDILGRHLEDKAHELDLSEYTQLTFRQEYRGAIANKKDLTSMIRTAVNEQMGAEIVGIQAVTSIIDKAIDSNHGKLITPILLTTDSEKLALDLETSLRRLNPRGVFLVVAGKGTKALRAVPRVLAVKDPSPEAVEQTLKTIDGSAKGK